jgi:hypothetical protein
LGAGRRFWTRRLKRRRVNWRIRALE